MDNTKDGTRNPGWLTRYRFPWWKKQAKWDKREWAVLGVPGACRRPGNNVWCCRYKRPRSILEVRMHSFFDSSNGRKRALANGSGMA
jgi:hypothetical protein